MSALTEALGIPVETAQRKLEAARGFGAIYAEQASSDEVTGHSVLLAASNYRDAGAHALLLRESQEAKELFQAAADLFTRAGSPYGVVLGNLGGEPASPPVPMPIVPESVFALWGSKALTQGLLTEEREHVEDELLAYRTKRVGVLGLEVGLLLELRRAALNWLHSRSTQDIVAPLNVVVSAYAEALRRARANRYHWARLRMTFHPLEPDVLGILVGLDRVLGSADASLSEMLAMVPQRAEVVNILHLSLRQFEAWGPE